jgi:hypothetical protein
LLFSSQPQRPRSTNLLQGWNQSTFHGLSAQGQFGILLPVCWWSTAWPFLLWFSQAHTLLIHWWCPYVLILSAHRSWRLPLVFQMEACEVRNKLVSGIEPEQILHWVHA